VCVILAKSFHVKLKGILFDVDGTLVDSNDAHAQCWLEAFAEFGKDFDYHVMRHQMGKGGDLLVPDLLNAREMRTMGEKVKKLRGRLFKKKYLENLKPFPGVKDCLKELHGRGIKLAFASSANPDEVEYYTQLLEAEDLLEGTTSKGDAELSKPSPEIFRAALDRIGTNPALTLVAGDTPYDVLAAHRVPLPIAAVLCGGFERELLAKAEFVLQDVRELTRKIDQIDDYFDD
jgi:phosphoglycolate phosphatase-like HAD superfamily hydrolase